MSELSIHCPCSCGETVTATFGDFATTEVEISACSTYRAQGIRSMFMLKSRALETLVAA